MINILQTSIYIIKTFNNLKNAPNAENIRLYVHSVYDRTINLMLDDQLVALQLADSQVSPISIILPLDERGLRTFKVDPFDPVYIEDSNLLVGKSTISFDSILEVYDDYLDGHYAPNFLQETVLNLILRSKTAGFSTLITSDKVPDDIALSYAKGKLDAAETKCSVLAATTDRNETRERTVLEDMCDSLSGLMGVGIGLTPGGDDFLTGILSTFSALPYCFNDELVKCLKSKINSKRNNTTEISRTFIDCALTNHFSKPIMELYNSICSTELTSAEHISEEMSDVLLNAFLDIGHSSGIDTLTGIWWSMNHLSKI